MKTKEKVKSVKSRVFKFEKGQSWDGDEEIIHYIMNLLLDFDKWEVKQKTYIIIQCVNNNKKSIGFGDNTNLWENEK